MDQRRGDHSVPENLDSKDCVLREREKALALLKEAKEKLNQSNGREEYAKNLRARDEAEKAHKKWEVPLIRCLKVN